MGIHIPKEKNQVELHWKFDICVCIIVFFITHFQHISVVNIGNLLCFIDYMNILHSCDFNSLWIIWIAVINCFQEKTYFREVNYKAPKTVYTVTICHLPCRHRKIFIFIIYDLALTVQFINILLHCFVMINLEILYKYLQGFWAHYSVFTV